MKRVTSALALITTAALFTACTMAYEMEEPVDSEEMALSYELAAEDDISTEATGDCSVSIQCSDGSTKSCSGTSGQCSASGSGAGSVTCNGSTQVCPEDCDSDGLCNPNCGFDPDCGDPFCRGGAFCLDHDDCGIEGFCMSNNSCICP